MTEPKYKIGDKVFRLYCDKAQEITVFGVVQTEEGFKYYCSEIVPKKDGTFYWSPEHKFFPSKEALIASL